MKFNYLLVFVFTLVILCNFFKNAELKSVQNQFHSDAIVTHWPTQQTDSKATGNEENEPGFMRRQLLKFGEMASKIGNTMGEHATKITSFIDKLCEIFKTVIPLLAAVCHVGQFKFCAATTDAPAQLGEALNPGSLDLNIPD
ncbi:uncharacterized protein [Leptinotarsa decemlineata]|uniref:uncharacterized protein n=1 Tax=Leptinotarsa decemlineata TaxID=7539 RepID=UPI003D30A2D3